MILHKGDDTIKKLMSDIKTKKFKNVYLFYGEEDYLKKHYVDKLTSELISKDDMMMNMDTFEGKSCSVGSIYEAFTTLPFISPYRVVLIKDSLLFYTGRKDDTEKITNYISEIPETSVVIFVESQIDKRGKLYKKLKELNGLVEFTTPNENELIKWINNMLKKFDKTISHEAAVYLLRTTAHNMDSISSEINKLVDYTVNQLEIKKEDIDLVCTKSLEIKIFDLVSAVGNKNVNQALSIYNNLLLMKEAPIMILGMVSRQFRLILQCKTIKEKGTSSSEISKIVGLPSFVVSECLKQGNNFTMSTLVMALKECLDVDIAIKTGRQTDKLGVEMLIIKYCM